VGSRLLPALPGFALLALPLGSIAETLLIRADKIIPVSGPVIRDGAIVVRNGKIVSVGKKWTAPTFARVLHAKVVMPGLVDAHSHLGCLNETDEPVDSLTPDLRACDAFDPQDPQIRRALAAGITTVGIAPGNGNVFGGQMSAVRLGPAPRILKGYAAQKLSISLDAASAQRNPTSRAGVTSLAMAALGSARDGTAAVPTRSSVPQTALLVGEFPTQLSERRDALLPLLHGSVPAFIHAPEAVDSEAALRLADAYRFKPVLVHCSEAYRLADQLRSRGATAVIGPLKLDAGDRELANPGKLEKAGVKVAFCSDGPLTDPGSLRLSAHLAVKHGMTSAGAVRALTLSGAEALGLASRTGSISVGKDADLLLLSGDPLNLTSRVQVVISGGAIVYEAEKR
jgi:imidazolonepropionase-like amidohydrolase